MDKLIRAGLRNPVLISVKEKVKKAKKEAEKTPSTLSNWYLLVDEPQDKLARLVQFLKHTVQKNEKV